MDHPSQSAPEHIDSYVLDQALIQSDRLDIIVDIKNVITDLDIYEHIDKPYLTGSIIFVDSQGIFTGMDFIGGERVTVKIKSTRKDSKSITKIFFVVSILNTAKVNDQNEVIGLQLIEDIGYYANIINVNKSYNGTCSNIIKKMLNEFLSKELDVIGSDVQQQFSLIVPNLNPIEAVSWVKNKATDINGFPFFLFSTFAEENLKFQSLTELMNQNPMNPSMPFNYWQNASTSDDTDIQRRTILAYEYANTDNLFNLIRGGVVGANYSYIDTFYGKEQKFQFDVMKDVLNPYKQTKREAKNLTGLPFDDALSFNGVSLNKIQSKTITQVGSSGAYKSKENRNLSYSEESAKAGYMKKSVSRAIHKFLTKSPMSIAVNGYDFIDGDYNTTIGKKLRIDFINSTEHSDNEDRKDPKRSGDYLIYASRHTFKKQKYDLSLNCVKIGNNK